MATANQIIFFTLAVSCLVSCVYCKTVEAAESDDSFLAETGRTFGHHFLKRISFAIIPAAFVVGVITTLLAALTVVSIKSLGTGLVLLILAIGQMIARTLPHAHVAGPAAYSAPLPLVYNHRDW